MEAITNTMDKIEKVSGPEAAVNFGNTKFFNRVGMHISYDKSKDWYQVNTPRGGVARINRKTDEIVPILAGETESVTMAHEKYTDYKAWQLKAGNEGKTLKDYEAEFADATRSDPTTKEGEVKRQRAFAAYRLKYKLPEDAKLSPPQEQKAIHDDSLATEVYRPPQSQIFTMTTAEGPKVAEYLPGRGTGGSVKDVQEGAIKGTLPASLIQSQQAFQKAQPVIDGIAELSEKINTGQAVAAKISGQIEKAKAMANLNDDVSEYDAMVSAFTPLLARAVGHVGVLTELDVQSVRKMFPAPPDSKSLRDRKVARLKSIFGSVQEATYTYPGNTKPEKNAGAGPAAPTRIVQHSKSTGAYRHSDDGGATWLPGQ